MSKARTPEEIAEAAPTEVTMDAQTLWQTGNGTPEQRFEAELKIYRAIALWAAREALREAPVTPEARQQFRDDLAAGKISVNGGWLVYEVDQCTWGGVDQYGHEAHQSGCGYEPLVQIETLVLGAEPS